MTATRIFGKDLFHSRGQTMNRRFTSTLLMLGIAAAPLAGLPALPANAQETIAPSRDINLSIGRGELITVPGMMDEPGSFSGRLSSPRPARGPLACQRMSLAIFISAPASVRSASLMIVSRIALLQICRRRRP